jgi:hypothetical protein
MKAAARSTLAALCAVVGAAMLTAACGGGGGDAGQNAFIPPTDDYNALAAWQNVLTQPAAWVVAGTASDGNVYELRLGTAPVGNSTFPVTAAAANRTDFGSSIRRGGSVLGSGNAELYYGNDFRSIGSRSEVFVPTPAESCGQVTMADLPPAAAKVGSSGALYTMAELAACTSGAGVTGSIEARWAIEFHAGTVYFCIDTTRSDLLTPPNLTTEKDCVQISASGAVGSRARISLSEPGFTITAVN